LYHASLSADRENMVNHVFWPSYSTEVGPACDYLGHTKYTGMGQKTKNLGGLGRPLLIMFTKRAEVNSEHIIDSCDPRLVCLSYISIPLSDIISGP